jgi:hypothetical protein
MSEDSKLPDNCNAQSHEFELWLGNISILYLPPNAMPLIPTTDHSHIKHEVLLSARFPSQA